MKKRALPANRINKHSRTNKPELLGECEATKASAQFSSCSIGRHSGRGKFFTYVSQENDQHDQKTIRPISASLPSALYVIPSPQYVISRIELAQNNDSGSAADLPAAFAGRDGTAAPGSRSSARCSALSRQTSCTPARIRPHAFY